MATQTSLVAQQVRIRQWAEQIRNCQNRPKGVNKVQIIRQSSKNPLKPRLSRHPLNTAVADEKYSNHKILLF